MRFGLIDRIVYLESGSSIKAVKSPSLSEEYLQDHFPQFPVMPGVLMLEAMYQASAWLIRVTDDFSHSVVVLKEARNIRYSGFVQPGEKLEVEAVIHKREGSLTTLKTTGHLGETNVVNARLTIEHRNLADKDPAHVAIDQRLVQKQRSYLALLTSQMPEVSA